MSLFKKLTDFFAGIAAFVGGLFLLQKYMTFKPLDYDQYISFLDGDVPSSTIEAITEAPSKISQFFTPAIINRYDYRLLAILVVTLIASVILGIIFKRLPYICFFISLFPAVEIAYTFAKERLYSQTGLFLLAGALHVAGNLYECIVRDKEDGRHRIWICAKISLLFPAAICLILTKSADKIPHEGIQERLDIFHDLAFKMTKPENMEIVTKIGWMYLIIFAIALVFYNVYFIDAILTAVPLIHAIHLLYSGNLSFSPEIFAVLAAICFMTHVVLVACENNLSRKEQLQLKNSSDES